MLIEYYRLQIKKSGHMEHIFDTYFDTSLLYGDKLKNCFSMQKIVVIGS